MNKKKIITVTVILVVAILGVGAYTLLGNQTSNNNQNSIAQNRNKSMNIEKVTTGDITKSITGKGTVETNELKSAVAPVKCKIKEVFVKAGAKVSKGDKLFFMDEQELQDEYEKAQSELTTAMKELGYSSPSYEYITIKAPKSGKVEEVNVSKKKQLSDVLADKSAVVLTDENGKTIELIIPKSGEVTSVNTKAGKKVKAGDTLFKIKVPSGTFDENIKKVEKAQAKVDLLKKHIDDPIVCSEFDGIVDEINTSALVDVIDKDTKVVSLQLQSGYMLSIKITQDELDSVYIGQQTEITFDSGYSLKGTVEHISYKADENGKFAISISLEETEQDNVVYPGIKANASIILEKRENVLRVPLEALKQDEKGDYVMVYTGKDEDISGLDASNIPMKKRYVERGLTNSLYAEIKSGIKSGEKVVVAKVSNDNDMFGDMFIGGSQAIPIQ